MFGRKMGYAGLALAAGVGVVVWWLEPFGGGEVPPSASDAVETSERLIDEPAELPAAGASDVSDETESSDEPQTEEEKAEAAEEAAVAAFDAVIEKWQEPRKGGVSMDDIASFAKAFRQVPEDRRDEEIHHALNLVPDENVMLLVGVLLDKSFGQEIVETVFNDVLNRDEDVKKPILLEIYKDKTHPCWADTAWILDVTGELPKAK